MKSLTHKLLAFSFVIALAAGCASVTDPGLADQPKQPAVEQIVPDQPDDIEFGSEQEMGTIVDKPTWEE